MIKKVNRLPLLLNLSFWVGLFNDLSLKRSEQPRHPARDLTMRLVSLMYSLYKPHCIVNAAANSLKIIQYNFC